MKKSELKQLIREVLNEQLHTENDIINYVQENAQFYSNINCYTVKYNNETFKASEPSDLITQIGESLNININKTSLLTESLKKSIKPVKANRELMKYYQKQIKLKVKELRLAMRDEGYNV